MARFAGSTACAPTRPSLYTGHPSNNFEDEPAAKTTLRRVGAPKGTRTPVFAVRGRFAGSTACAPTRPSLYTGHPAGTAPIV
jgi:hypothetical protein